MSKISTLPPLVAPTGAETVVVLDGTITKRASMAALAAAAVAPEIARADAIVDKIASRPAGRAELALVDGDEQLVMTVTPDRIEHPHIGAIDAAIGRSLCGRAEVALVDDDDQVVMRITPDRIEHPHIAAIEAGITGVTGRTRAGALRLARLAAEREARWTDVAAESQLLHSVIMGQSNGSGVGAQPARSTTPTPGGYTFPHGVRFSTDGDFDPSALDTPLIPLVERDYSNMGETIASGATRMLAQLLAEEDGVDFAGTGQMLLWTSAAIPGQSIDVLDGPDTGGSPFHGTIDNFYFADRNGRINGTPYQPLCADWLHGEADQCTQSQAWYEGKIRGMRGDLEAAIQARLGTTRPLPWLTYQTCSVPDHVADGTVTPAAALAQLAVAGDDHVAMVAPTWMLPWAGLTDIHFAPSGQYILGAYFGWAKKRWFFDRIKPRPITIRKAAAYDRCVMLDLDVPSGAPITIDTALFPGLAHAGFTMATAGGVAIPIEAVEVVGGTRIKIRTGSVRSAGEVVRHGWIGVGQQLQGGVRDTAGDDMIFDPAGIAWPMHHYLPVCRKAVQ